MYKNFRLELLQRRNFAPSSRDASDMRRARRVDPGNSRMSGVYRETFKRAFATEERRQIAIVTRYAIPAHGRKITLQSRVADGLSRASALLRVTFRSLLALLAVYVSSQYPLCTSISTSALRSKLNRAIRGDCALKNNLFPPNRRERNDE